MSGVVRKLHEEFTMISIRRMICVVTVFIMFIPGLLDVMLASAEGSVNKLFANVPGSTDLYSIKQGREEPDRTVVRSRYIYVNFDYLYGKNLPEGAELVVLNLFDSVSFTAVKDRLEVRSSNRYTWFGRIDGVKHGQVILTVENGGMAGNIILPRGIYQIRAVGNGIHAVYEIDQSSFPEEAPPLPVNITPDSLDFAPRSRQADDGSVIDVMVVYTPAAAGASADISAEIQLGIDETNQSYVNSGINQRVGLVHTAQVTYTGSGDMILDLTRLQDISDGHMDEVHTLRDTYGADVVSLWIEDGNFCGIAYLMTTVSHDFESYAFSTVRRSCATGHFSFGHEMGHNMSADHDWYVNPDTEPFPYNHGYVYLPDRWRTYMAYKKECEDNGFTCVRIPYWSNPDVSYNSVPTGVPEGQDMPADNRKTLNNTSYTVANFRQTVTFPVPDVKANNLDGPLTITQSDSVSVTVDLDAGTYTGKNADWWVLADAPFGWYYYELPATDWQVVYQTDFSIDPGWTSNSSENYYWDPSDGTYYANQINIDGGGNYSYYDTGHDGSSFRLEWDINIFYTEYGSDLGFGLFDTDLNTENESFVRLIFTNGNKGRTTLLMWNGLNNSGYVEEILKQWTLGTWYNVILEYTSVTNSLTAEVRQRDTGQQYMSLYAADVGSFDVDMGLVGTSNVREGVFQVPGAHSSGKFDNVTFTVPVLEYGNWLPGQVVTYQGPLFGLRPYEVLNMTALPAGAYTVYFGVDTVMNGSINMGQLFYDSVDVEVIPQSAR